MRTHRKGLRKIAVALSLVIVLSLVHVVPVQAATGWMQDVNGWSYYYDNGSYASNKWEEINGKWYWFDEKGYMATGWRSINGQTYFFTSDGTMVTGMVDIGDRAYYFNPTGELYTATNWQEMSSGQWYYFYGDHSAAIGWKKINGQWYYFNPAGVWVNDNSLEAGTIKGIDVSKWQGEIDWNRVRDDGIQFTFIRIGHGSRQLDTYYNQNIAGANAAGIPAGVYYYSTAQSVEESIQDAQFVINNLNGHTISYPVAIDLEADSQRDLGRDAITQIAKAFCDEVQAAGYTPMVYCNEDWYRSYIDFSQLGSTERWIARYNYTNDSSIGRHIWQAGSTYYIDGINGKVDINFGYKNYCAYITPRTSVKAGYTPTTGFWKSNAYGWWFQYLNGGYPAGRMEWINGNCYYFDGSGYRETGWTQLGNAWYYFDGSGAMRTGWLNLGGTWYYLNGAGVMQTGWVFDGYGWYYMEASGRMTTGWQNAGGAWYYMNSSGRMTTGWQYVGGTWYYMNGSGVMTTGWQNIYGTWYYLNGSGAMQTGWIRNGYYWYYFESSGAMNANCWRQIGGVWYYFYGDGSMATNTWINGYYVNAYGAWV